MRTEKTMSYYAAIFGPAASNLKKAYMLRF